MSDNYNNRTLLDQGWKEMSRLLDRDMPVTKKNRRFLWYFLVPVLLLIGTGLGFAIYSVLDQTEQKAPVQEEYVPMADLKSNILEIDAAQVGKEKEATLEQDLNAVSKSQEETKNVNSSSSSDVAFQIVQEEKVNSVLNDPNANNLNINNPNVIASNNYPSTGTYDKVQNQQKVFQNESSSKNAFSNKKDQENSRNIVTESVVLPIQSDLASEARVINFLNRPILGINTDHLLLFEEPIFAFESIINPIQLNKRKIGLSAGLRASFNGSLGVQGIGVGPDVRIPIGRNVGMYAGLLYEFQKKNGLLDFSAKEDAALNVDINQSTVFNSSSGDLLTAVSTAATYDDIKSLSNSFHYLHLPIGIEYAISQSLSLHGGVRLSRLLSAPSKYEIAVVQGDAANQDLNRLSGFSNNALFQNDFVRKNDISATLGGSVYLGRKWALSAEYNHGLLPIIGKDDTDGTNAFNRIFSVGLRYHFSRT